MEYQVSIDIHQDSKICFEHYSESKWVKEWLPKLKEIISTKGKLFDEHSEGYFMFDQNGHDMAMDVFVESKKKPHDITITYRVPGALNRCINHFIPTNQSTRWTMDVEFIFDEDPNLSEDIFKSSTLDSMRIFKEYIEEFKHES